MTITEYRAALDVLTEQYKQAADKVKDDQKEVMRLGKEFYLATCRLSDELCGRTPRPQEVHPPPVPSVDP